MAFDPQVDESITIDGKTYKFVQNPAVTAFSMTWGQEGGFGTVYQVVANDGPYALKVFKPRYRKPEIAESANHLRHLAVHPGLQACERTILTPEVHRDLIQHYPDLAYAVLMPWVGDTCWFECLQGKVPVFPRQSQLLAGAMAEILTNMELWGLAHCDLSSGNVMVTLNPVSVSLVDMEGMFGPRLPHPLTLQRPSDGYAHHTAPDRLWSPVADRFSGAVLMAEMLGWCDESVRKIAHGESFFDPDKMPTKGNRRVTTEQYDVLRKSIAHHWGPGVAGALDRSWKSATLDDCPRATEWKALIDGHPPDPVADSGLRWQIVAGVCLLLGAIFSALTYYGAWIILLPVLLFALYRLSKLT